VKIYTKKKIKHDSNLINNQIYSEKGETSGVNLNYDNQINSENYLSSAAFSNQKNNIFNILVKQI
jgi:Na+-transporting NADH:ubiquinone oxidoreductase subunit NqrC